MKRIQLSALLVIFLLAFNSYPQEKYPNTPDKDFSADAPWRVCSMDTKIPVLMTIVDGNRNPCSLNSLTIDIWNDQSSSYQQVLYQDLAGILINQPYWEYLWEKSANELNIPPYNLSIVANDTITLKVKLTFTEKTAENFTQYLRVYVGADKLPNLPEWYNGDTHFHSEFTHSDLEYGSSIRFTAKAAVALGLDWLTITDHSCDFHPDLFSDFNQLNDSIIRYNEIYSPFTMLRGEEITVDHPGLLKRIHLLAYNSGFIQGPELAGTNHTAHSLRNIDEVLSDFDSQSFAYASHPFYEDIFIGTWDLSHYEIAFGSTHKTKFIGLEFWNTRKTFYIDPDDYNINPFDANHQESKEYTYKTDLTNNNNLWDDFLRGHLVDMQKVFAAGGSDAHGDLNYQIERPAYSANIVAYDNAIAKVRTVAFCPNGLTKANVLNAFKNGHTVVTDGPMAAISVDLNGDDVIDAIIGDDKLCDSVQFANGNAKIKIQWNSTNEFGGSLTKFVLYYTTSSATIALNLDGTFITPSLSGEAQFSFKTLEETFGLTYPVDQYFLIRLAAYTADSLYRCYTNPIWLKITNPSAINLNITALIEGRYNIASNAMVPDSVQVSLVSSSTLTPVDSTRVSLDASGNGLATFRNIPDGSYYIKINHRSALETWSKSGGEFLTKGSLINYNFSDGISKAYSGNMKAFGSSWCLFNGDVNQDGIINTSDINTVVEHSMSYETNNRAVDLDGNGLVDISDIIITDNNGYSQRSVKRPVLAGSPCHGIETVTYAEKTYNTVQIGEQCWLKENLNVGIQIYGWASNNGIIEKFCYEDNEANCEANGGLYQWDEAMQYITTQATQGICPDGWHVPMLTDLQTLSSTVGGNSNALKEIGQGADAGAGTNTSGFSALLGGYRDETGLFAYLHNYAYFWISTGGSAGWANFMILRQENSDIYLGEHHKVCGFSVRCVKD